MVNILETSIWTVGVIINLTLIIKLLRSPSLWSTINIYLSCVLLLNCCFLISKIVLFPEEDITTKLEESLMDYLLRLVSFNHQTSLSCSTHVLANFFHGVPTMLILLGVVFIRLIMIKHAEKVRQDKMPRKRDQARLSMIGVLVGVLIITLCLIYMVNFIMHDFFPNEFIEVRICKGVYKPTDEIEKMRFWWMRMSSLALMLIFTLSCNIRIFLFRRQHGLSYFSRYRQNIATAHQTFAAIYIKIIFKILKEILILCIIFEKFSCSRMFLFLMMPYCSILECIIIPGYWIFSTKSHFPELWSTETLFWNKVVSKRKLRQDENGFTDLSKTTPEKVPRGPYSNDRKVDLMHQNVFKGPAGKFSYKMRSTHYHSPSTSSSLENKINMNLDIAFAGDKEKKKNKIDMKSFEPGIHYVRPCYVSMEDIMG